MITVNEFIKFDILLKRSSHDSTLEEEKALKIYELEKQCKNYLGDKFICNSPLILFLTSELEHDAFEYIKSKTVSSLLKASAERYKLTIDECVNEILSNREFIIDAHAKVTSHYTKYKQLIDETDNIDDIINMKIETIGC